MINWNGLVQVAAAAIGFTLVIVSIFSLGLRFSSNAQALSKSASKGNGKALEREALNRVAAYFMFAITIAVLIYGIYLVIPHAK